MTRDWFYFSNWELSDGNKWTPLEARGIRKSWKHSVQGELKKIIAGADHRLVVFSGKDKVAMLDIAGQEIWQTSLFEGGPKMNEYDFPPYMVDGAWFYRETLFAQMAGVAPIQLDPDTGEVKRRSHFGDPDTSENNFDPEAHYYPLFRLFQGNWLTVTGPGVNAKITRSGLLERVDVDPLSIGLGWRGVQSGGRMTKSANAGEPVDHVVEVLLISGGWTVFKCHKSSYNRHLRIAKDGDYNGEIVVLDAVDAFITGQSGYLVTKHHDERRSKWWLECRLLNDPERVLWRTEACGWMTWFMGTGDTVWHTEWCGPGVKGKDWLIGRDLVTGAEIYRKAEACRFMGLFCGPLIITASARSITAWEAIL